jgi:hypothetical protein
VARTLTEDTRNPDVLYLGTETGLFVSIDRGGAWQRIKANLPTVRIDEITIHPRDNAMLLATHGRAIWILDHLAPIQEYAAAQKTAADAALFSPPPTAMYRRPARDRNYEFWGDQTFFGENPPQAAVIAWHLKKDVGAVALRITDATGREVREISGSVLANSTRAGIHSACWDLRVSPIPIGTVGGGRQGGGGGRQGGAAGSDAPQASFGAGCSTGAGGGGGGGFGFAPGGGNPGPYVLAGTYNVSLVVDGKPVDSKPLRVAADPEVVLTQVERKKLFDMAMEMHELQRRTSEFNAALSPFSTRVGEVAKEVAAKSDIPADVKSSLEALQKDLTALVAKVAPPAGGGRGFGFGGGATTPPSPVARLGVAKNGLMGGMLPTQATINAYNEAKVEVPKVIAEVNALLSRAAGVSAALAKHGITLTVPAPAARTTTTSSLR